MWIVRLALRRPYTFVVAAMLVLIMGILSIIQMPTDIFPNIDIPVISVIFNYSGMAPEDMGTRVVGQFERFLTTTVNDIEHIESQSLNGVGVVKVYFQKGAKIEAATAQVTAVAQTAVRIMPPGMQPPLILQYNASSVPIVQLSLSSDTMPEQELFDQAVNVLRPQLVTIHGIQIPYPYGGKQRQIIVDLDPGKLYAYGLSPQDVSSAINAQNLILPAGSTKIGTQEYQVMLNSSPEAVAALNDLPIKAVRGTTVYVKDVAHVRDGFTVQTNIVHANGKRGVLLSILKLGNASTLDVVNAVKEKLPQIQATLPKGLKVDMLFDQSLFVRASVDGVVREAAIAAGLTALMILLFLGSWRSTLIVMLSIPLSILVSIIVLYFLGQTLNVMTLGGMALAVGILVDDATVTIENIERNEALGKGIVQSILDGARQIAVPAFVSTLCICIVFVPVVFISGAAKYLFTPLALAVVFAMLTSYVLSRTLVPTMIHYLSKRGVWLLFVLVGMAVAALAAWCRHVRDWRLLGEGLLALTAALALIWLILARVHGWFSAGFEWFRRFYGGFLDWALEHRLVVTGGFAVLTLGSCALYWLIGNDFFPDVDAGQIRLHVRCPPGTRVEESAQRFAQVENAIERVIPKQEITTLLDNIGIPNSGINLSLSDGSMISPADGEILISLAAGHHPTADYMRKLRAELPQQFPGMTFYFASADIVTQVLNFGLSAPVDVQIAGPPANQARDEELARQIQREVIKLPGVVDVRMQQVPRTPDLRVDVDRTLASEVGVTQRDVASDLLISLSSSNQTAPNFWLNPQTGVTYSIYVQTPQYAMATLNELENTPVVPGNVPATPSNTQLLENLASTHRGESATNVTHYNIFGTYDVLMAVQGADLQSAAERIQGVVDGMQKDLPRGSTVAVRGQVESMHASYSGLGWGLLFAVVLVYLLMVINFQSWLDPLIILTALPGALAGILWMLWATQTTISVPALMGAIMSIGVATANSILMVTFANDQRLEGMNARQAALSAGLTRLRPVLMTALAMVIGMLPMALGLGEGGEENAPLGRAVIGGLTLATFATLFFVPVVYSLLRRKARPRMAEEELMS